MRLKQLKIPGFTLAELLTALTVISVIATFNIVKITTATETAMNKARLKEIFTTLQQIEYEGWQNGTIKNPADFMAALRTKLQVAKFCNTRSDVNGCWSAGMQSNGGQESEGGIVLHSGIVAFGFKGETWGFTDGTDDILIDVNGAKGPNEFGVDTTAWTICYKTDPDCYPAWSAYTGKKGPGTIFCDDPDTLPLFIEMMKQ